MKTKITLLIMTLNLLAFQNCSDVDLSPINPDDIPEINIANPNICLEQPDPLTYLPGVIMWYETQNTMKIHANTNALVHQYNVIYGGHNDVAYDWYIDDELVASNVGSLSLDIADIVPCRAYQLKAIFLYCGEHEGEVIEQEAFLRPCDP
jgi:hypothetical protein